MIRLSADVDELRRLHLDLSRAPARIQFGASKAVMRGAELIDEQMVVDASGHRYLPHMASEVSHERLDAMTAEIGITYQGQGKLAHIIVYGSVNNGPVYDHMAGPRRAMPVVEQLFGKTAEDSVLGGNE